MNSDLTTAAPPSLPPHVQLIQMGIAGWVSAVVYHAAKMKLADRLADGPKDAAQVAAATNTHAPTMHRFMRTLAGYLTHAIEATLGSWRGRRASPVYQQIPNLREPDWKTLKVGEINEFWE